MKSCRLSEHRYSVKISSQKPFSFGTNQWWWWYAASDATSAANNDDDDDDGTGGGGTMQTHCMSFFTS